MPSDSQPTASWWRAALRQRRHHKAFRIPEPRWDHAARRRFRDLLDVLTADLTAAPEHVDAAELPEAELARAATNLWLARRKFHRASDASSREHRQIGRYLAATEEGLRSAGVTLQEHDGQPYDPGFSLEVVAFRVDPALAAETVQETVRPSVYLNDRLIKMGQVIVGTPADSSEQGHAEDTHARHH